jgi:hypothetical protein
MGGQDDRLPQEVIVGHEHLCRRQCEPKLLKITSNRVGHEHLCWRQCEPKLLKITSNRPGSYEECMLQRRYRLHGWDRHRSTQELLGFYLHNSCKPGLR